MEHHTPKQLIFMMIQLRILPLARPFTAIALSSWVRSWSRSCPLQELRIADHTTTTAVVGRLLLSPGQPNQAANSDAYKIKMPTLTAAKPHRVLPIKFQVMKSWLNRVNTPATLGPSPLSVFNFSSIFLLYTINGGRLLKPIRAVRRVELESK